MKPIKITKEFLTPKTRSEMITRLKFLEQWYKQEHSELLNTKDTIWKLNSFSAWKVIESCLKECDKLTDDNLMALINEYDFVLKDME